MSPNQQAFVCRVWAHKQRYNMVTCLFSFHSFYGQLCPIITGEVEALNANLSMLEGES